MNNIEQIQLIQAYGQALINKQELLKQLSDLGNNPSLGVFKKFLETELISSIKDTENFIKNLKNQLNLK